MRRRTVFFLILVGWASVSAILSFVWIHTSGLGGTPETAGLHGRTVFVGVNYYESEEILPQSLSSLLGLVRVLGDRGARVFISVYESGSRDKTKEILADFDRELGSRGIERSVVLDEEPGWWHLWRQRRNETANETYTHARVRFLAHYREHVLAPLKSGNVTADFVLFLNDVLFNPEDAERLLLTDSFDWDAVCAMDFNAAFYDTWVSRDINGQILTAYFPFVEEAEAQARLRRGEAFEVLSCWNGMLAFKAHFFVFSAKKRDELPGAFPSNNQPSQLGKEEGGPLSFRAYTVSEPRLIHPEYVWDTRHPASECFLIFKDLRILKPSARVVINPRVNVAYSTGVLLYRRWLGSLVDWLCDLVLVLDPVPRKSPTEVGSGFESLKVEEGAYRPAVFRQWARWMPWFWRKILQYMEALKRFGLMVGLAVCVVIVIALFAAARKRGQENQNSNRRSNLLEVDP
uniref:Glycosyltransferase family 69 protein n=1 Tax=Chromera velia CCMP2878 TaxID=1169474 RepID=A0A0G4FEF2_9ALVE|eukprot:Cvel_16587.t1-p1 / transcript=Cvel_16587.t1 / gene=Cvel_16587 / organism=Chromera_velia_CCMP2878 / gene_product=hypothetical protein / transcript_product=hypothetical protein / location=Cvel_scaffold1284:24186-25861(-) / protein_length=459 / sequence_SO=supercontig / SO=protein_coding / is_pseudo=false